MVSNADVTMMCEWALIDHTTYNTDIIDGFVYVGTEATVVPNQSPINMCEDNRPFRPVQTHFVENVRLELERKLELHREQKLLKPHVFDEKRATLKR